MPPLPEPAESHSPSPQPPSRRIGWRGLLGVPAAWLATLLLGLAGLLLTTPGLHLAATVLTLFLAGQGQSLQIDGLQGRLCGPIHVTGLHWRGPTGQVRIQDGLLDWQPRQLWQRQLLLSRLHLGRLDLETVADETPLRWPDNLALPLDTLGLKRLEVEDFRLQRLYGQQRAASQGLTAAPDFPDEDKPPANENPPWLHAIRARVQVTPEAYQLDLHHFASGPGSWQGQARLQTATPYPLAVHLIGHSQGATEQEKMAAVSSAPAVMPDWLETARLDLAAQGNLKAFRVNGKLHVAARSATAASPQSMTGQLAAEVTPFAALPLQQLELDLPHVNPAAWLPDAPRGALAVSLKMQPEKTGRPSVASTAAAHDLPFAALHGQLRVQQAEMAAGRDQRLPAALPPLQLSAGLHWQAATRTAGQRLAVNALQIASGAARLQGRGEIRLGGPEDGKHSDTAATLFQFNMQASNVDPSRLHGQIPAGRLHARADLHGRWSSRIAQRQLRLDYTLLPGTLLGQSLQGQGSLDWQGEHLHRLVLAMQSGPNRLHAAGSLGQPDDRLHAVLDAPHLQGLPGLAGIQGDLHLDLMLRGSLATVQAIRGEMTARSTRLQFPAGPSGTAGLHLQALTAQASGTLAAHQMTLQLQRATAPALHLALQGQGSLTADASRWQGQLRQLLLRDAADQPLLQLDSPIPLFFSRKEIRLDAPARFLGGVKGRGGELLLQRLHYRQGGDWQTQGRLVQWQVAPWLALSGQAARLPANSPPLDLDWQLAAGRTLRGEIGLHVPDLAWLGPLLGPDWKSGGQLQARLQLAGTPRAPLLQGRIDGEKLSLLALNTRLQLEQGQLHAEWQGDTLTLQQLSFDSRLQPAPRPLRTLLTDASVLQTALPGKLTARGALRLGRNVSGRLDVQGGIDIEMQRLGALQQEQQWLLLSGKGRLQGQGRQLLLSGAVQADAAWFELPPAGRPRLSEDVVIRGRMPAAQGDEENALPLDLALALDLGRAFHFRGGGLNSRLAGQINLSGPNLSLPRATGVIRTVDGSFDAYGRTLALERGIVNFQGSLDNPGLNIRALRPQLAVAAGIEVSGTVQQPRVQLVSVPEVPDAEKLSWLVLGTGTAAESGTASGLNDQDKRLLLAAASGLFSQMTGEAGGGLLRPLQDTLGIDVAMSPDSISGHLASGRVLPAGSRVANAYGFSSEAGGSASGQMVSLSKRLSGNLLLAYEQALGSTASMVRLTLNLGRRFALVGRAGTDNALDLLYEFSFGR